MCDLTEEFHQTLSLLRNDRRLISSPSSKLSSDRVTRANIFRELFSKIKSLLSTINQLRSILIQHRKDYINVYNPLEEKVNLLNDAQRDEIDRTFETFQRELSPMLIQIKLECTSHRKLPDQMKEHCLNVLQMVENYAKRVCRVHLDMKKFRVQRAIDRQKVNKLASHLQQKSSLLSSEEPQLRNRVRQRSHNWSTDEDSEFERTIVEDETRHELDHRSTESVPIRRIVPSYNENQGLMNNEHETLLESLSEEEIQAYRMENEQLYDEMNALNEEVKKIEGQVVEIAHLQELFTEKVLQQEQELNRVNMTVIGTTEDIKGGNQQLREAMKKNADFRVWILFFIIMLSFAILFLDWYNP